MNMLPKDRLTVETVDLLGSPTVALPASRHLDGSTIGYSSIFTNFARPPDDPN